MTSATATEQLIPLKEIAKLPLFAEPRLSPDGEHVAVTIISQGKPFIVVQKLETLGNYTDLEGVMSGGDLHINWYEWANNDRLVVEVRKTVAWLGDLRNLARMGSINKDGSDVVLFRMRPNDYGFYRQNASVVDWLEDDPDHILAALDDEPDRWHAPQVHKVNIKTGKRELVVRNRRGVFKWIADANGEVRVGTRYDLRRKRTGVEILYRETVDSDWETLQKVNYFDQDRLEPYRFDKDDPNILLVTSTNLQEQEELDELDNLYRYDLSTRQIVGAYVNEQRKHLVDVAENALPDMEVEIVSLDKEKNLAFFKVYTDIKSPEYYLLDLKARKLDYVAAEYPSLVGYELSPMSKVNYTARDGMDIPAFLTIPHGVTDKNLPLVVFPHGGPWAHDEWGFNNYVQFMANRGYAVFQPQFRGSTGHGIDHEEAGYGEWGKAIQDDITDGVQWLIETGVADPQRICIVGGSFGGYAAAMGAAKTPDLYKCVVSVNGVLDMKLFIEHGDKMLFENINRAMWNSRAEAKETSPYHLAKNIKAPMLLIGSERDTVVPVKHSRRMYKRLRKLGKPVEYVELPDGEHWRTDEANELITLEAIEKFLAKYLGPDAVMTTVAH